MKKHSVIPELLEIHTPAYNRTKCKISIAIFVIVIVVILLVCLL
jgi:hypothetical protein